MPDDRRRTIRVILNGQERTLPVEPAETLLDALRAASCTSVKYGCGTGDCGACTVLFDGEPIYSCQKRAVEADGHQVFTVEGLAPFPAHQLDDLHPIQRAFTETGAIQCGYCTPAQILTAKALLDRNPEPTRDEIQSALSGVLCRCTGYVKIVQAVERAAVLMRGEGLPSFRHSAVSLSDDEALTDLLAERYATPGDGSEPRTPLVISPPDLARLQVVGGSEPKVDSVKLASGAPAFTDDVKMEGMLHGALLTSPHAHARIRSIDTSEAAALEGVHAVLTHHDIPRVKYASGGQSFPQPGPYDQVCLDDKVRHVGDRVAVVAAESPRLARRALRLIEVDYELLPHVLDAAEARVSGSPVIHDEPDTEGIYDPDRNTVHRIEAAEGDREEHWRRADYIFEREYRTSQQQHAHVEPHACITYWDEDGRLVVRTSTQVPFHIRRMLAPLVGLSEKEIHVIKPRIGGGFGNKQEMILEDLCAHLTVATGRPVRMMYSRSEEFTSSRSRHPTVQRYRVGVTKDMEVVATELDLVGDTGAYGTHGLTVNMVAGQKGLTLYNTPYSAFRCDVVYTNKPTAGAFRGYGAMQTHFGIETLMSEIASEMGWDVVEFKRRNWIREGELLVMAKALGEGREGFEQQIRSSGLAECVRVGLEATAWYRKRRKLDQASAVKETEVGNERLRHGIGMSVMAHGSGIAGLDMAAATIRMNDDGSFTLLVGAADLGTGSDTILAQIAAEELGVGVEDILVHSSDTDFTPFDKGAYASSTTYVSGNAVRKAAVKVATLVRKHAAAMLGVELRESREGGARKRTRQEQVSGAQMTGAEDIELHHGAVWFPDGRRMTLEQVALSSLHQQNQHQIVASASHVSHDSPPPFGAQFVEVVVDAETGQVTVERVLMTVDAGRVINPITASGQVEGGIAQGLGFALCEEMVYDADGRLVNPRLGPYHVHKADEMPEIDVIFVETDEPTGPYGAKSVAELPIDGVAPAIADAIHDATGIWLREVPFTPERVWRALRTQT